MANRKPQIGLTTESVRGSSMIYVVMLKPMAIFDYRIIVIQFLIPCQQVYNAKHKILKMVWKKYCCI